MADFTKPTLTSTYTNFITELKARDNTISSLFSDGTDHTGSYPVRAIRWNSAGYFQRRNSNNNGWERLEGNGGTHYFENVETGAITATGGATITGAATATGQIQANNFNVTGTTKPTNGFYLPASNEVRFTTNSTDRFTIESNGQVGINQVNPAYGLDITGTFRIQNGSSSSYLEVGTGGSGNRNAYIDLVGDDTNTDYGLRVIRSNGGKNGTSSILHKGTGDLIFDCINAQDTTDNQGADVVFKQSGVVKVKIRSSSGFVGIGDEDFTPSEFLHIKNSESNNNATIRIQNSEGNAYIRADNDDLFLDADFIQFRSENANSTRATISGTLFDIKTNAKVNGNLDVTSGVDVTGNITVTGNVDGRNIANDGSKLDGIEPNATADQTNSQILTLLKQVDDNDSGLNSNFLQGKQLSISTSRWGCVPFVDSSGTIEIGKNIDFHLQDDDGNNNNDGRIQCLSGSISVDKTFLPSGSSGTLDLGSSSARWKDLYVNDLKLSNEGSANDVDGTWGDWTLQEAEETIYMINHRNGKKYSINMTEVAN